MAMIKCRECGHEISTKAATCPKCGAAKAKGKPWIKWTVAVFFGYFVYSVSTNYNKYTASNSDITSTRTAKAESSTPAPSEDWKFSESVDQMSGEKSQYIVSTSKNTLQGWLKSGSPILGYSCTHKQLYIKANSLGLHTDDIDCTEYGCSKPQYTRVKFDDKPPQNLVFDIWDDDHDGMTLTNKSNINGLPPTQYMLKSMKSSNKLFLEVKLFNTKGNAQIAEFGLNGFSSSLSKCN